MFLIAAIVLLVVLPSPWDVAAFAVLLLAGAAEVAYYWRKVKDRRVQAGAETLIGSRAEVVSGCRPDGQVAIEGALWSARCEDGADRGDVVRVVSREGLVLMVEMEKRPA